MKKFNRNRGMATAWVFAILGLILIGAAVSIGLNKLDLNFFGWSLTGERYERSYTESFSQSFKLVNINTLNGEVKVIGWGNDYTTVEIKQTIRVSSESLRDEYFEKTNPVVSLTNGELIIITPRLEINRDFAGHGVSIYLNVPTALVEEITVRTSNGAMELSTLNATVSADSSNGKIEATSIEGNLTLKTSNSPIIVKNVSGSMDLETSNGGFTGTELAGNLRILTSNGNINIDSAVSNITATTSNGEINLTNGTLLGSKNYFKSSNGKIKIAADLPKEGILEVRSSNGQITLSIPPVTVAHIDASTSNGRVDVLQLPITISSVSKTSLKGNLNGVGELNIILKTSNANIVIESD